MEFTRNNISTMLVLVLLMAAGSASAQIYEVVNDDGSVEFTDRPPTTTKKGRTVEEVQLQELNTTPGTPLGNTAQDASSQVSKPEITPPATVTITAPENESTFSGPGNYSVSAAAKPALGNSEQLILMINGVPFGGPQQSGIWQIVGSMRGTHDLLVQRRTSDGRTVAQSEAVRIYVLRPSVIGR